MKEKITRYTPDFGNDYMSPHSEGQYVKYKDIEQLMTDYYIMKKSLEGFSDKVMDVVDEVLISESSKLEEDKSIYLYSKGMRMGANIILNTLKTLLLMNKENSGE